MRNLRQSLVDYDREVLVAISATLNIEAESSKDSIVESLVNTLSAPLTMRFLWEELAKEEQQALCELSAKGGWMPAVYFEHRNGQLRHFGPARLLRERLWEAPENVTERLYFRGLIYRGFSEDGKSAIWYIPAELMAALPLSACPQEIRGERLTPLPLEVEVRITRPANEIMMLALYHTLVQARSSSRRLIEIVQSRLMQETQAPDEERAGHMARLGITIAQEMRFLEQGRTYTQSGRARARQWLQSTRAGSLAHLARAWLASTTWHELLHAPGVRFEGGHLPDPALARRKVMVVLARLEPGRWYKVMDLQSWFWAERPDFLRSDLDFDSSYFHDAELDEPLEGLTAWTRVEGRFLEEILVELNALNALSLGVTATGEQSFRVERSAWWLGNRKPEKGKGKSKDVKLSPNLELELSEDAPLYRRYQLDTIAEAVTVPGHYRLTGSSLRRAVKQGISSDNILALLAEHAVGFDARAEHKIRSLLATRELTAEPVILLSSEDVNSLEIVADRMLSKNIVACLPDGRIVISSKVWPAAKEYLQSQGFEINEGDSKPRP